MEKLLTQNIIGMKTLGFLKKFSFREGFFSVMMLVAVAAYVISFVQTPTGKTLAGGNVVVDLCLLALCLLTDFPKFPSEHRAERMRILAPMWVVLLFFVTLVLAVYSAFAENIVFTGQFFASLCGICLQHLMLFLICGSGIFFNYKSSKKEVTGGIREVKNK